MSNVHQVPAGTLAPVAAAVVEAFNAESTVEQATILARADQSFEKALEDVATAVARILTDKPSFEHWETVATAFQNGYRDARACTEETARKRWSAVCVEMDRLFALTKPAKPTQAAAKKAEQRTGYAEQAKAIIADAKAANAEQIMRLASDPKRALPKAVVQELVKAASSKAQEAQAAAQEAAAKQASELRKAITKELARLTVGELSTVQRVISGLVSKRNAKATPPAEQAKQAEQAEQGEQQAA